MPENYTSYCARMKIDFGAGFYLGNITLEENLLTSLDLLVFLFYIYFKNSNDCH